LDRAEALSGGGRSRDRLCRSIRSVRAGWLLLLTARCASLSKIVQIIGHFLSGLITLSCILRDGSANYVIDVWWEIGVVRRDGQGLAVNHPERNRHRAVSLKRPMSGKQSVQNDTQREQIGSAVDGITVQLFGGHVCGCTKGLPRYSLVGHIQLGDTKIGNLRSSVASQENIGRLDISMNNALRVCVI